MQASNKIGCYDNQKMRVRKHQKQKYSESEKNSWKNAKKKVKKMVKTIFTAIEYTLAVTSERKTHAGR